MRRVLLTMHLTLLLVAPGAAQQTGPTAAQSSFAEREIPELAKLLELQPGMTAADVGAGFGACTIELSKVVGASGRVYSTDIGASQLAALRNVAKRDGHANVVIESAAASTNLPALCYHAILIRDAYHHLTDPAAMVKSLADALKPGGLLAVIDFPPRTNSEIPSGVPADRLGHGVPIAVLEHEVGAALVHVCTMADWNQISQPASLYLVLFRKP